MRKRAQGKELPRAHSWEGAPDLTPLLSCTAPVLPFCGSKVGPVHPKCQLVSVSGAPA